MLHHAVVAAVDDVFGEANAPPSTSGSSPRHPCSAAWDRCAGASMVAVVGHWQRLLLGLDLFGTRLIATGLDVVALEDLLPPYAQSQALVRACQPAVGQRQTSRPGRRRLAGQCGEFADQMGLIGITALRRDPGPAGRRFRFAPAGKPDGSASCAPAASGARPSSDRKRSTRCLRLQPISSASAAIRRRRRCAPAGDRRIRFRATAGGWRDRRQNPRPYRSGAASQRSRRVARAAARPRGRARHRSRPCARRDRRRRRRKSDRRRAA